jgi:hypothetical protein
MLRSVIDPASANERHAGTSASGQPDMPRLRGRGGGGESDQRRRLLERATELDSSARRAAQEGDLAASARSILEALDCERRAGSLGPQVLQLIKPRAEASG